MKKQHAKTDNHNIVVEFEYGKRPLSHKTPPPVLTLPSVLHSRLWTITLWLKYGKIPLLSEPCMTNRQTGKTTTTTTDKN